jgi:peptidoglycan/xylan/chitin deacetylase (PgdA/CDA1 family)
MKGRQEVFTEVLCYHHVGDMPWSTRYPGLWISPKRFRHDLSARLQAGYIPCPLDEALHPSTQKRFVLTFDDGLRSVFQHSLKILDDLKISATQFLVSDCLGRTNSWDTFIGEPTPWLMDPGQIREWLAAGHSIGGHTCTHPHLSALPLSRAREEITVCKTRLEDLFQIPVRHFAYPYGDWSVPLAQLVEEAGYETAWTITPEPGSAPNPRYALPRHFETIPRPKWKTAAGRPLRWMRQLCRP